ncbi:glycosyltransferase family 2 protein [Cupriavidus oxalaticus]|uniref:Glycosyltransferase n=1 Tax=Cupriavidus oxalaticus TaxID=96344 RepID=A0A375GIL5_9BURK|nr:glycosyltransferase [Cupriavidus oxalaticus]QRQ84508.1 glycosyltransferase [Cupriavidus oxalaticus]QRQ91404.1 glycosyltransferase [Cupriavidus oxalaticus]WQD85967.1 glycosyltransferase [Cupriavidus oxalaticus]SPC10601.1 Predicted glycosyltransferase [Cupriavidus oxalaticus]SPC19762.1 Predicted glycosyltransferase [Cupriavidus oxalaticus]
MPASTFLPTFSVCILTCDHPEGLQRALQAVAESTMPPHQLIVTDDSSGYATREMMRCDHPDVTYLEGPRRCRAANRNRALRAVTGSHVLFLDDQTLLGPTFLQQMAECIADDHIRRATAGCATPLILTGTEVCQGQPGRPRKPAFLGDPTQDYRRGERLRSVLLHSAVFPRALFEQASFDEQLAGGYDELELTGRAVQELGYRIELVASAVNQRLPDTRPSGPSGSSGSSSPAARAERAGPACDAARLYVACQRYRRGQRRPVKTALFLLLALPHALGRDLRTAGARGASDFYATAGRLWQLLRDPRADRGEGTSAAGLGVPLPRD